MPFPDEYRSFNIEDIQGAVYGGKTNHDAVKEDSSLDVLNEIIPILSNLFEKYQRHESEESHLEDFASQGNRIANFVFYCSPDNSTELCSPTMPFP